MIPLSTVSGESEPARRRRRSEARRNVAVILDAAVDVFAKHPDAGLAEVARAAGLTRQTVYAHFSSREALINAAMDKLTDDVTAAMDSAALDDAPPAEALQRFLLLSWDRFEHYPLLPRLSVTGQAQSTGEAKRHGPVLERLDQLIRRGQQSGAFDADLPATWLVKAVVALGHTAGEHVILGTMTPEAARSALLSSVQRLVGIGR